MQTTSIIRICIVLFVSLFQGFLQLSAQTNSTAKYSGSETRMNTKSGDYATIRYRPEFKTTLSDTIKETSGVILINGLLWTINDSGNPAEMYQVDTTNGNVLRTVVIQNAINADWESITQDKAYVFIGDFGNNNGNRRDLRILKIPKDSLLDPVKKTVQAEFIRFFYPDQTVFTISSYRHNFDCEAFVFLNDSLHLFSKNWSDLHTKHYVIPAETGTYTARLIEQFDADGLITDASVNKKGKLALLGYKNSGGRSYECFIWLFYDYTDGFFFDGRKKRIELGSALHLGQTEGITFKSENTGWISSESIQSGWFYEAAKLFSFDFGNY